MAHSIPMTSGDITRRRALSLGIFGLGGLIGAVYVVAILRYIIPLGTSGNTGYEDVGPTSQFKPELPVRVPLGVDPQGKNPTGGAWIIQHSATSYTAFDMHCTHLSCPYNWTGGTTSTDGVFACPCHGSVFNKDGSVMNGPAFVPLRKRSTRVQGSNLTVGGLTS
jgi:menaquinol-cytochrome c reductase iron-sulfur subunit